MNCDGVKTVYIDASGECEVTAGDIKTDDDVEILNKDLHICSLGPDAMLNMEITMSRGRGYVPADRNKTPQTPIGVIPVDSLYSPVYKVNYTVENTRVGNMTDFDKLTLEVWTDSTTTAKDAVSIAAKILTEHLALFTDLSETVASQSIVREKDVSTEPTALKLTIEELDQHQHRPRSDLQNAGRDDEGPQHGQEVARRGAEQAGHDGPVARDGGNAYHK